VGIVGVVVEVDTAVVGVDTEGTASGMGKQRLVVGVGVGTTGTASGKQCLGVGVGVGVGTVATAIAIGRLSLAAVSLAAPGAVVATGSTSGSTSGSTRASTRASGSTSGRTTGSTRASTSGSTSTIGKHRSRASQCECCRCPAGWIQRVGRRA
jgi:hypothetical protein